jgi:hypothetical protein
MKELLSFINNLPNNKEDLRKIVWKFHDEVYRWEPSGRTENLPLDLLAKLNVAKILIEKAMDEPMVGCGYWEMHKIMRESGRMLDFDKFDNKTDYDDACERAVEGIEIERTHGKMKFETDVKFDYSVCNHPQWQRLIKEEKEIAEKRKNIENYLQGLRDKEEYIDPDTGEICDIYPPEKTSTRTIKITMNE